LIKGLGKGQLDPADPLRLAPDSACGFATLLNFIPQTSLR
jgi:hypothetical protein